MIFANIFEKVVVSGVGDSADAASTLPKTPLRQHCTVDDSTQSNKILWQKFNAVRDNAESASALSIFSNVRHNAQAALALSKTSQTLI
jgi:hypothetical protein